MSKILITGATGFIGGRICEFLAARNSHSFVAGFHTLKGLPRLARLKCEVRPCNVLSLKILERAMNGVDRVIHCASGPDGTIDDGTRNVLEAGRKNGISRLVHLSTIEVYGRSTGTLTEDMTPTRTSYWYNVAKVDAERACISAAGKGLSVVLLRPGIVYGPFCKPWMIRYYERWQQGALHLLDEISNGTCNAVYVDDVVGAILRALEYQGTSGSIFNVVGPDCPSWNDYFNTLSEGFSGSPLCQSKSTRRRQWIARALAPTRSVAKYLLRRHGTIVKKLYSGNALAKASMRRVEALLRQNEDIQELDVYSRRAIVSNERMRNELKYQPHFSLEEGVRRSVDYLKTYFK